MPAPVVIQFVTTGLPQIVQQLKAAGKQAQQTAAQTSKAAQKAASVGVASLPAAAAAPAPSPNGGGATPRLPSSARPPAFASGPNQRLASLRQQLPVAVAAGNTNAASDIQLAIGKAEKQLQNSQPQTFAQKAAKVLASSRISSSGQIMPLVGQLAGLAGEAAPGVGAALALASAAMTAAKALGEMTASSAAVATSFNNFQNATGTSGMGTAQLAGIGGSIGLSPDATASLSASLSEHLRSDPFAIAAGARMGLGPALNRPFDTIDEGDRLTKAIEGLRRITDRSERLRTARALGIEAALPIANQSESQYQFGRANDRLTARVMTPAMDQRVADYNASQAELTRATDNLKAIVLAYPTQVITSVANGVTAALNNIMDAHANLDRIGSTKEIRHFSDHDAANDAMDKNSDALKANTQALTTLSGNFGSPGARLSSALPAGFNLQYLTQLLNNQSGVVLPPF